MRLTKINAVLNLLIVLLVFTLGTSSVHTVAAQGLGITFTFPGNPKDEELDGYIDTMRSIVLLQTNLLEDLLNKPELELTNDQKAEIEKLTAEIQKAYKELSVECEAKKERADRDQVHTINREYQAKWEMVRKDFKSEVVNEVLVPRQAEMFERHFRKHFYGELNQANFATGLRLMKKIFDLSTSEHDEMTAAAISAKEKMAKLKLKIEEEAAKKIRKAKEEAAKKFIDELPKSTKDKIHEELGDDIQLYIDLFIE